MARPGLLPPLLALCQLPVFALPRPRRAAAHAERLRLYSSVPCRYKSADREAELSSNPEQFAMSRYPLLLLPVLCVAILVLGGALDQKPVDGRQPAVPAASRATVNDPKALALLDQAMDALSPQRIPWMEATVWQQVRCDDFTYQACGRVLTAPGDRSRFDVNVKVGKTQGEMRLVCDGQTLWQSIRLGSDTPAVTHWDLPAGSAEMVQARAQLLHEEGFGGLAALLGCLRRGLQNAQCQRQIWKGHEVMVIGGVWPLNTARLAGMPDFCRPRLQARLCRVFLDAQTLWLDRLEWWGSEKPSQQNSLLVQTEFRDPVVNRPLSPEQCVAEFTCK
jgi:hypothetical protein